MGQSLPQPGGLFFLSAAAELFPRLVGFEQGLLHDPGKIDLTLQARLQLQARQKRKVFAALCQRLLVIFSAGVHAVPYR
jgi:hypothetical protein